MTGQWSHGRISYEKIKRKKTKNPTNQYTISRRRVVRQPSGEMIYVYNIFQCFRPRESHYLQTHVTRPRALGVGAAELQETTHLHIFILYTHIHRRLQYGRPTSRVFVITCTCVQNVRRSKTSFRFPFRLYRSVWFSIVVRKRGQRTVFPGATVPGHRGARRR